MKLVKQDNFLQHHINLFHMLIYSLREIKGKKTKKTHQTAICCHYTILQTHFSRRNREKIMISGKTNVKLPGVMKLLIPSQHLPGFRSLSANISALLFSLWMIWNTSCASRPREWNESRQWKLSPWVMAFSNGAVIVHQTWHCGNCNCSWRCCFAVPLLLLSLLSASSVLCDDQPLVSSSLLSIC